MGHRFEALFPLIFDSINDGVFTVDEQFKITSFNSAAERIVGIERSAALGRRCHEVFRASICQRGCALRETLRTGEPRRDVKVDVLNAAMDTVPIAVSTAVLRDRDGQLIGGVEIFRDVSEVETLRSELDRRHGFHDIIGQSPAMQEIFALIPQLARSDAPVLITGPSGTGKELVAHAIHELSARRREPFVRVNCGALPDTLLESELFGHAKGAFTGAVRSQAGRFRQADRGSLLLDEIGDVSPAFQVKLLRALEEGEIQPLGESQPVEVDVRLIAATNRNLGDLVREGRFREDLYYRIRVIPIDLPPLAERREDIPLLAEHFCRRLAARAGRAVPQLTPAALQLMYDYSYPGNVRELRNILERAFVLSPEAVIDAAHLPTELGSPLGEIPAEAGAVEGMARPRSDRFDRPVAPNRARAGAEARRLLVTLDAYGWSRAATAAALGISRTTLWRRMRELGLLRPA
jgi:PAS domain S-box-containing protein